MSAVPFHLSPAQSITGIIDYSTPEGRKYFERSIVKLREELFDCEDDLHLFLAKATQPALLLFTYSPALPCSFFKPPLLRPCTYTIEKRCSC